MSKEINEKEKKLASGRTIMNPQLLKELYKLFYKENYKTLRIILTVIGAAAIVIAVMMYGNNMPLPYIAIALWIGVFALVYPRNMYRTPYKRAKDEKGTMLFSFYDTYMKERAEGETKEYRYADMDKLIESPQYLYFFHTKRDVSVLEKSEITGNTAEGLTAVLKMRVNKYKVVK